MLFGSFLSEELYTFRGRVSRFKILLKSSPDMCFFAIVLYDCIGWVSGQFFKAFLDKK